jgi:molecular chaperone DnaK
MAEIAVGIDLGTSNSCVAVARGRKVEVLPNAYGENITASVVSFREDGSVLVGNTAKANLIHDPRTTVASAKRLIGRYSFSEEVKKAQAVYAYNIVEGPGHGVRVEIRDEQFSLPEISAMVLREMKTVAEERIGQPVRKAVIAVPAYFNDNQRQATKDAGRIAGLEVLRLLNEPTAAALAYGFGRGLNQRVAVYDLGGGTFDISILEIGTDVFEVLATCGDTYLGGDDFDDRIIDLLADGFLSKHGVNLRSDPYAFEKLKFAAENAKRGLSMDELVEVRIPDIATNEAGESLHLEHELSSAEFSSLVMDLIQRTFKVCDEALQQANMVVRDLDGVILVGGPTRLPLVREAVSQYFGQEPKADVDPDEVVAMGASIHAASLVGAEDMDDAFLLDVTPLSLRIGVAGGLAETVIERNTPVPIEQTRTFTTFQDGQESVKIRVYQGESRQAAENELLGQFEFAGFAKAARGHVRIDVTFEINGDGIVNVLARDQETGEQASTTITLASGLSEEELAGIIDEDRADRVQTLAPDAAPDLEADAATALDVVDDGDDFLDAQDAAPEPPIEAPEPTIEAAAPAVEAAPPVTTTPEPVIPAPAPEPAAEEVLAPPPAAAVEEAAAVEILPEPDPNEETLSGVAPAVELPTSEPALQEPSDDPMELTDNPNPAGIPAEPTLDAIPLTDEDLGDLEPLELDGDPDDPIDIVLEAEAALPVEVTPEEDALAVEIAPEEDVLPVELVPEDALNGEELTPEEPAQSDSPAETGLFEKGRVNLSEYGGE